MTPSIKAASPWLALAFALVLLGSLGAVALHSKFDDELRAARDVARQESQLLAALLATELADGRYQNVEGVLGEWARANPGLAELTLTSANGFVLANHTRPVAPRHGALIEVPISYSYHGRAQLRAFVDLDQVRERQAALAVQLVGVYFAAAALLALLLHLAIQRQREAERRGANERRLQTMIETEPECVKVVGADGRLVEINAAGLAVLGVSSLGEAQSRLLVDFVVAEDRPRFIDLHKRVFSGEKGRLQFEIQQPSGARRWLETHATPLRDNSGSVQGLLGVTRDITESHLAQHKIRRLSRVQAVLSGVNAAIVRITDRAELFREACRIAVDLGQFRIAWLGVIDAGPGRIRPVAWAGHERGLLDVAPLEIDTEDPRFGFVGRAVMDKVPMISQDVASDERLTTRKELAERGVRSLAVLPLLIDDQAVGVLALYASDTDTFDDQEMRLLQELAGDVAFALDHIAKIEKIDYLAYYDALTGLANRTLLTERLSQAIATAVREDERFAVGLIDIERFRMVNDSLGRHAADGVLKQFAERIVQVAGDAARVARLGMDQFVMLQFDVEHEESIVRLLERGREAIEGRTYVAGEVELALGARVGIAMFPHDGADPEALLRNAEAALERAKATGEKYLLYAEEMTARVADRLAFENRLRKAIEREEFVLHYQPKVRADSGAIVGVEALIRWDSPHFGLVPPGRFIPLLEETGLILQVGAWALRRAALDHRAWVEQGLKAPRVAVNVSPTQLRRRDFVAVIQEAIAGGTRPPAIDLEITETLIMEDIEATSEKLRAIRAGGMAIAIDDFGTGYSSLSYLAKLPVGILKIDGSFIASMIGDSTTATLVQSIITLAHSLRLDVVAEGVETEEQARALQLLGCDQLQGYFFSEAVPADRLAQMLAGGQAPSSA